ncbi:Sarcolemma associated protein [Carabus blaptoides fortunei]
MVVDIRTWVKNVVNQPPSVVSDILVPLVPPTMSAKAVLICRPNSHPFQERTLILDQPVKVGRSVARARATPTNAIFDCKVLSRHHALLWYENGKFYLQDTKSSNGTFVNNNRLSAGGAESVPHEVCSGDIVQFGVDVVENNRKVTHGCIVATLKLYLHDGKEAKASHSLSVGCTVGSVPLDELYKLNQYLQDALQREQLLESKLNTLQNLVEQARDATNLSWQAFIGEDRLLSRVEILESQLLSYSKNYSEDKMREELVKLQEDKNSYQNSAKESLRKLHQERLDAIAKLTTLQQSLTTSEQETAVSKEQLAKLQDDLQELAQRYSTNQQREAELTNQLSAAEEREREADQRIQELLDRLDGQKDSMLELHKQLEKFQQDKLVLQTLITELDKCTVNNCPLELKYKVEKIVKEALMDDIKNTNVSKSDSDEMDHNFEEQVDNHKDNNVPFMNQTEDSNKLRESKDGLEYKEIEEILLKLQDELKQLQDSEEDEDSEENDIKAEDLDNLREQITHWTARLAEESGRQSQRESQTTLLNETLDNSHYVNCDTAEYVELKQKLQAAQNDVLEKTTTISKMSEEVEHLLETSALVSAKLNLLESDLHEERATCAQYMQEVERLRDQLNLRQHLAETPALQSQLEALQAELCLRPTMESFAELQNKCSGLEKIVQKIKTNQQRTVADSGDMNGDTAQIDAGITELEEELVVMKEKYAECNVEKLQLNKSLESLQKEYNALANRSHNIMFLYMAPLVLLLAYLLLTSLFS